MNEKELCKQPQNYWLLRDDRKTSLSIQFTTNSAAYLTNYPLFGRIRNEIADSVYAIQP